MNFEHYKDINLDHEYVYRVLSSEAVNAWNDELELETFYSDGAGLPLMSINSRPLRALKIHPWGQNILWGNRRCFSLHRYCR